jgi:hypothetical protein
MANFTTTELQRIKAVAPHVKASCPDRDCLCLSDQEGIEESQFIKLIDFYFQNGEWDGETRLDKVIDCLYVAQFEGVWLCLNKPY